MSDNPAKYARGRPALEASTQQGQCDADRDPDQNKSQHNGNVLPIADLRRRWKVTESQPNKDNSRRKIAFEFDTNPIV